MNRVILALTALLLTAGTRTSVWGQILIREVNDGGHYPAGWSVWTRQPAPNSGFPDPMPNIKFEPLGGGYHLTIGNQKPALVYRSADQMNGPFRFAVKFDKTEEPFTYPEGYGLFFGGKHLDPDPDLEPDQIEFLVRSIGRYLIRRRSVDGVVDIKPWTPHAAIQQTDASGHSTNVLAIEAQWNSSKVVFLINGQRVDSMAVTADELSGLVGIRANWDQDLQISDYVVQKK